LSYNACRISRFSCIDTAGPSTPSNVSASRYGPSKLVIFFFNLLGSPNFTVSVNIFMSLISGIDGGAGAAVADAGTGASATAEVGTGVAEAGADAGGLTGREVPGVALIISLVVGKVVPAGTAAVEALTESEEAATESEKAATGAEVTEVAAAGARADAEALEVAPEVLGGSPPTRLVVKNPPLNGAISPPEDGRRDVVAL
jgi:hypothetical protein